MTGRGRGALWIGCTSATLVAALLAYPSARRHLHSVYVERAVARLTEVAARRSSSARISIAHAGPAAASRAAGARDRSVPLYAAAVDVLGRTVEDDTLDGRHASAIAHYYIGRFDDAIRELESLAAESERAELWSDLAAARLESSITDQKPHELVPAFVAVSHALRIDPLFAPALYNRAAIVERLGLHQHAQRAWHLALVAESDSTWQEQIRQRLRATEGRSDDETWDALVARMENDAGSTPAEIDAITARFAQQARLAAETALPCDWGAAVVAGDAATAKRKLDLARGLAAAVRRQSGESLAAESIAVIDDAVASGDAHRVARLAAAYALYRQARLRYSDEDHARAEAELRSAAREFAAFGSPMEEVARYYAANTIADRNRVEEASVLNAEIARTARAAGVRHRALAASASWQMARYEGVMGHWDRALDAASESVEAFRALGEKENAGAMENMLAELYDRLEQGQQAWTHRVAAFELLSSSGETYRLQVALAAPSRDRIRHEDWPAAVAFLGLEVELSHSVASPALLADALARRARARTADGDSAEARRDILLGRAAAARIPDRGFRANVDAILDAAEGVLERDRDPALGVRLLSRAIEFHARSARSIRLPELFLERGRAYLAMRAEAEALADFDAGIRQLEQQRAAISDFELNSAAGDAGAGLFMEAVRVAVRRGDAPLAYDYSERSRGRALAQRLGSAVSPVRVNPDVTIIEYMTLPEQVIAFVVDDGLRMTVLPIHRADLQREVAILTSSIVEDRPMAEYRLRSSTLYDLLLRPLAVRIRPNTAIVASGVLERVPWGALHDQVRGRYLVEDTTVLSAPTAAAAVEALGDRKQVPSASAFVVGDPRSATTYLDLPPLAASAREAEKVASYYGRSRLLVGAEASRGRFVREAKLYDVIHFAGHAVSSDAAYDQSFLVLAPDRPGDSGLLYARDITRLPFRDVRLIVLAACGTIRGSTMRMDGMPSIGRAFLAAGVRAVIGTLWEIDERDSTDLFVAIHRAVAAGRLPAEAVREAQLSALRNDTARLKTWAAIVVMGGSAGDVSTTAPAK